MVFSNSISLYFINSLLCAKRDCNNRFDGSKQLLLKKKKMKRFIMNTLFLDSNNLCVLETHKSFLCVEVCS